MSTVVCKCKHCGVQIGVRTGMSGGGHVVGIILTLLTGFLALPLYVMMMMCSGSTRCSNCGRQAQTLR